MFDKIIFILCSVYFCSDAKIFVTFTFDDGLPEHYSASKTLDSYNMKGTFHINSGRIDSNTRLSKSEIESMQQRGHEIAGHTVNHTNLGNVDSSARRKAICDDAANLNAIGSGIDVTSFAYPYASTFNGAEGVLESCGFTSARTSGGIETPFDCDQCPLGILLPPR
jgi:peptidoglycan/xylan/chitin deacetylase (PgdA/CDA1 family)